LNTRQETDSGDRRAASRTGLPARVRPQFSDVLLWPRAAFRGLPRLFVDPPPKSRSHSERACERCALAER